MSEPASKSRFAIDLDDLEKQLKTPTPAAPAKGGDALAELARIVGRDDPLKGLFAHRGIQASSPAPSVEISPVQPVARIEPTFHGDVSVPPADNLKGALDEFDALLRRDIAMHPELGAVTHGSVDAVQAAPVQNEPSVAVPDIQMVRPSEISPGAGRIDDPFISELEQHGRAGLDHPPLRGSFDERRAPHDLDEPRDVARGATYVPHDQLSKDLDDQLNAYPLPPVDPEEDMRSLEPRKSRKGLITIGALLGVAVIGVVGATTFRSGPNLVGGEPPVIKAETGPNKVAPVTPGGTEVPNQNKQIYERGTETKTADTKIVSREEQPVDVAQAARTAARVILPATVPAPAAGSQAVDAAVQVPPAVSAPAVTSTPSLGEPRKVRTVSIKPDGSVLPQVGTTAPVVPAARTVAAPTMTMPASVAPQPLPKPVAPKPAAKAPVTDEATADAAPLKITPAARPKNQERAGERVATATAPTPVQAPTADTAGASGSFAVQLGAPGSEAEARSTFAALQRKFPGQLGGKSPLIRKAEVNGRDVYRLRVGPLSRESAASLCTSLQGAGGQCFIAKN